jgi:hypothetical protein
MELDIRETHDVTKTLQDFQIRVDEIDEGQTRPVLSKGNTIHAKSGAHIHDFLSTHPVCVQRVIPASMRKFRTRGDILSRSFPFGEQRRV